MCARGADGHARHSSSRRRSTQLPLPTGRRPRIRVTHAELDVVCLRRSATKWSSAASSSSSRVFVTPPIAPPPHRPHRAEHIPCRRRPACRPHPLVLQPHL
ncbi:hypothetical protein PsYK624_033500 [Phanerochaete sordida]|uniref:Uncharacterized protein n=1 Tax=Phanerochaete sordida TaxID=48140 RepID=A0A9P3LAY1_9APHY|nr:hypothetical protein PsYK624_033500 [Phanerochaete sordida]